MSKLPSITGFYVNEELKTKLNERISQVSKIRVVFFFFND